MISKLKKQEKGFTIIEVLIVLAIAGLIILIVFLAVPALQRNSRNTQRKNDVSAALGAIQEYTSNNNVKITDQASLGKAIANGKFSSYDPASEIKYKAAAASVASTDINTMDVVPGAKCATVTTPGVGSAPPTTSQGATNTGASSRNLAVIYQVETGGAAQIVCQDS